MRLPVWLHQRGEHQSTVRHLRAGTGLSAMTAKGMPRPPMRADVLAEVLADLDGDAREWDYYQGKAEELIAAYMAALFLRRQRARVTPAKAHEIILMTEASSHSCEEHGGMCVGYGHEDRFTRAP